MRYFFETSCTKGQRSILKIHSVRVSRNLPGDTRHCHLRSSIPPFDLSSPSLRLIHRGEKKSVFEAPALNSDYVSYNYTIFSLHLTPKEGNRVEECFDNQVRRCNKFIISGPCKIDLSAPVADFFLSACVLCFFFLAAASRPVELHFELLCFMCRIPMNFHCKLRFGMPSEFRVSLALGVFFLFSDGKIEVFEIK